ncbi:hypothetical protein SLS62_009299 [Diatrype stigma]|uniref:chitinase n=1 Tax=Diatrype stigma TaxID=117547 RepID=A0AAN9UHV4_9PEZI
MKVTTSLFRSIITAAVAVAPFAQATATRSVIGHPTLPTDTSALTNITHVVLSFADPAFLANGTAQPNFPFTDIAALRQKLDAKAKVGVAIGGWEKSPGFSSVTVPAMRQAFISNTKNMVDTLGLDFIDIDWEYPGGDGIDYVGKANDTKTLEIQIFPQLLEELKAALGADTELSVAVAGRLDDIAVYGENKTNTQRIWDAVDFVNVMSYDLMNRRDSATLHSSSVRGANATVDKYTSELNLAASKINLGFPLYAKYFQLTQGDGCAGPLGCSIIAAEAADGSDTYTSDYVTFEAHNLVSQPLTAENGSCGANSPETRCSGDLCCSRFGNCGSTEDFCNHMCLRAFGRCNVGYEPDMVKSFQTALSNGKKDDVEGAMWYIDEVESRRFFWTWDSVEIIERKVKEVVNARGLGGVMAWSLGEDSPDGARIKAINAALSM